MANKRVSVKDYVRRTASGKIVQVQGYGSQRNVADEVIKMDPARPSLASKSGQFPNGRSVPGVFPEPVKANKPSKGANDMDETEFDTHKQAAEAAGYRVEKPEPKEVSDSVKRLQGVGAKVDKEKPDKSDSDFANKMVSDAAGKPERDKMDARNKAERTKRREGKRVSKAISEDDTVAKERPSEDEIARRRQARKTRNLADEETTSAQVAQENEDVVSALLSDYASSGATKTLKVDLEAIKAEMIAQGLTPDRRDMTGESLTAFEAQAQAIAKRLEIRARAKGAKVVSLAAQALLAQIQ